ncbi:MAG TPA: hypothetical protein DHW02_06525, partial [Ktedonobacter sp.]|nr:hypothetical protein [Ktedonobacter sp.]
TIHLVVARLHPDTLDILADEVDMVRIGESVTATGAISPQKRDTSLTTLRNYKAIAEHFSASPVLVVATEAIRQASNSADFVEDVRRETGLDVQIVPGDVEASLTFAGSTYELLQEPRIPPQLGVMDLGGGSLELVTASYDAGHANNPVQQLHITWRTSVPLGSGWIHDRYLLSDPPSSDELSVAYTFLTTYLKGMHIKRHIPVLTVTGGSANSLLHLSHHAFRRDLHDFSLSREDIVRCEGLLHSMLAEEIAMRFGQPVERARILPAGALIIRTVMEHLHLERIQVSPHGIREGVLLAYAQYGDQWLQQVGEQASQKSSSSNDNEQKQHDEPFNETGRRLLKERTEALFEWRDAVVKGKDSEAVHKMRVASRRLRAVLDAYEPLCEPQLFQRIYQQVKKMANLLGKVRDTDVMIGNLKQLAGQEVQNSQNSQQEQQEGVDWLVKRLRSYRKKQQRKLKKFFKEFDQKAFEEQIHACLASERWQHGKG